MNENKICPMLSTADSSVICQGERCAWYAPPLCAPNGKIIKDGRCAVQYLGALPDLVQKVGQL